MKCPICGEVYTHKRNFCVLCGADLNAAVQPECASEPEPEVSPAPSSVKKQVTAEDFFGPSRPVRRTARMTDLSVSGIDLGDLVDANLQRPVHVQYMRAAQDCGIDRSNIAQEHRRSDTAMYETQVDASRTLAQHTASASVVAMADAAGCDRSNCVTERSAQTVTMSDDIRPVEALPKAQPRPLDEIDALSVPDFFRKRRTAAVSLEIPNLECC